MELRPATRDEFDAFSVAALRAFHRVYLDEDRERYTKIDEPERSLAWFDGDAIVATTGAFTRVLAVPGATVPCAAVTAVAVVPTHRRRGLLTSMMRRQLDDLRERGDLVAALWASEGMIYGRYGYGIGVRAARLIAHRPAARLARPQAAEEPLRAGPAGEHVDALRAVHARVQPGWPGMLDRPGAWWDDRLYDPERNRDGAQPLQAAIVADGYALYAVRPEWSEDGPAGEVRIRELVAATPAARARLWGFLVDQDLTTSVTWDLAPVDDPLWLMLSDPVAARVGPIYDALWLRLVDVEAALRARTYASDPGVVIDVTDAFCAWNAGRYRLAGGVCERTDAAPDLALDVTDLAVVYLGGTTLRSLWEAGRVEERTPGAVGRASAAFRGDVEPWSPDRF